MSSRSIASMRVDRAEHLAAERVVGEQRLVDERVHPVVGLVLGQEDLLEDHLALGVDLVGPERGIGDDVGEQVEPDRQLLCRQPRVVGGVLRAVKAFISPPTASTASAISLRGARRSVPLNSRCSRKCEAPASSGGSSRPPTPTQQPRRDRAGLGHPLGDDAEAVRPASVCSTPGPAASVISGAATPPPPRRPPVAAPALAAATATVGRRRAEVAELLRGPRRRTRPRRTRPRRRSAPAGAASPAADARRGSDGSRGPARPPPPRDCRSSGDHRAR